MPSTDKQNSTDPASKDAKPERIYIDNSDLNELKYTCDEAVERILTRSSANDATTPASSEVNQPEANGAQASRTDFSPFKASHFHTDLRLATGFTAALIMIGTTLWAYFVEKEWQKNKQACGIAVALYTGLSAVQALDSYLQGNTIFSGKRKMLSKRIETESLRIVSPSLPFATQSGRITAEGKPILTPPVYSLKIDYTRKSNGGKSLLGRKKDTISLGHMGEWVTEDGEFIESIFEERLISGLQKAFGQ